MVFVLGYLGNRANLIAFSICCTASGQKVLVMCSNTQPALLSKVSYCSAESSISGFHETPTLLELKARIANFVKRIIDRFLSKNDN